MAFKKGNIPWNLGKRGGIPWNFGMKGVRHHSEATKIKMSMARIGHTTSEETKKKLRLKNTGNRHGVGRIVSDETRKKLRVINLGKKHNEKSKQKMRLAKIGNRYLLGKHHSEESKRKMSMTRKGKRIGNENPNWTGGEKLANIRSYVKRKSYGSIFLNDYFDGSEGHHIDKDHVIFIPKSLHRSVWHSQDKLETMERMNTLVFIWLLRG